MLQATIRYVQTTKEYGLYYKPNNGKTGRGFEVYSDADFSVHAMDRKLTTGALITYHEQPIAWRSAKQSLIAMSTAKV